MQKQNISLICLLVAKLVLLLGTQEAIASKESHPSLGICAYICEPSIYLGYQAPGTQTFLIKWFDFL